jgi:hypothetical protein
VIIGLLRRAHVITPLQKIHGDARIFEAGQRHRTELLFDLGELLAIVGLRARRQAKKILAYLVSSNHPEEGRSIRLAP